MKALLKAVDAATRPVHAVVTTEQQIFERGQSLPDAKSTLAPGCRPGRPPSPITRPCCSAGTGCPRSRPAAASEFERFLRKPDSWPNWPRPDSAPSGDTPPHSDVTSFARAAATLSVGDDGVRAALANAVSRPGQDPAATIMLDSR